MFSNKFSSLALLVVGTLAVMATNGLGGPVVERSGCSSGTHTISVTGNVKEWQLNPPSGQYNYGGKTCQEKVYGFAPGSVKVSSDFAGRLTVTCKSGKQGAADISGGSVTGSGAVSVSGFTVTCA